MTHIVEQISTEVQSHRNAEHGVSSLFLNRWSPRAFDSRKVADEDLNAILEAAHWAPSSFNDQPWRFVVAKTEEQLAVFHNFLGEFNQIWATKAPVLVLVASDTKRENGDPNGAHAFDAGTAWGYLALEATLKGLAAHAIGGFDRQQAKAALNLPEQFELHAVIAIGYQGDKSSLPAPIQEREVPSGRKSLSEVVIEGSYK
ncbi:nitroreductase family protein [Paenibacillus radicis (ex Gao et al. 2016)]|uniref:Oxidoreductase n=1 Tax=Paenibacillus radicis (ex Gao et al. 2016) TaxID=1737354 RepID=A0A917LU24_9BACL|nr:nitroreductase family protein [Paenibacillus radicis (ex Gao et al. 2016)]GGG56988.1 oxidoreductase [Paenibacillus radicis (ex Gao et al. 2016)]